jgi:hypothetical protein
MPTTDSIFFDELSNNRTNKPNKQNKIVIRPRRRRRIESRCVFFASYYALPSLTDNILTVQQPQEEEAGVRVICEFRHCFYLLRFADLYIPMKLCRAEKMKVFLEMDSLAR